MNFKIISFFFLAAFLWIYVKNKLQIKYMYLCLLFSATTVTHKIDNNNGAELRVSTKS